jgi:hypothetical protein
VYVFPFLWNSHLERVKVLLFHTLLDKNQ